MHYIPLPEEHPVKGNSNFATRSRLFRQMAAFVEKEKPSRSGGEVYAGKRTGIISSALCSPSTASLHEPHLFSWLCQQVKIHLRFCHTKDDLSTEFHYVEVFTSHSCFYYPHVEIINKYYTTGGNFISI